MLRLTQELRHLCAKPHGRLYSGESIKIGDIEEVSESRIVVTVGDVVSLSALNSGFEPDIIIIDKKTGREISESLWKELQVFCKKYMKIEAFNPAGHLTYNLAEKILEAKEVVEQGKGKVMIFVDGEEDLSVIPLVCIFPEGSLIVYGQPGMGVVALRVTDDKKILIHNILEKMERVNGNGSEIYDICGIEKQ